VIKIPDFKKKEKISEDPEVRWGWLKVMYIYTIV